jgi:hypothetical protein
MARLPWIVLAALLAAGLGLRLGLGWTRTGFIDNPDSFGYVNAGQREFFIPPMWPAGYPIFLHVAHALSAQLSFTIAIQHLLGMASAVLLFLTVRQVAPAGWGLIPAAVILLAGPQLFLEHAPLSESPFTFLVIASCFCAVRALGRQRPYWAFAAGMLAVTAACVRSLGVLLPVLVVVWLVASTPGTLRRRLIVGGAAALGAWLVLVVYIAAAISAGSSVGPGLTRAGAGWNLYQRAGPFADCRRFDPPRAARGLCERRPPADRPPPPAYAGPGSPAVRLFGLSVTTTPASNAALTGFARRAIVHQPFDYLRAVGTDLTRYWSSDRHYRFHAGASYDALVKRLTFHDTVATVRLIRRWYATGDTLGPAGAPAALRVYERHTRFEGPAFVLLALCAVVGLAAARGRRLAAQLLLLGVSTLLLVGTIAASTFDAQYAIPGYGPLAAAGALGAASLWERLAARRPLSIRARRRALGSVGS